MFERILLSVDGSEDSDKAVRVTRDLARLHGSEVFVVHGRDLAIVAPPSPQSLLPLRQAGRRMTPRPACSSTWRSRSCDQVR